MEETTEPMPNPFDERPSLPSLLLNIALTAAVLVAGGLMLRGSIEGRAPAPAHSQAIRPSVARVFHAVDAGDRNPRTVYIVASQEQAEALHETIYQGDIIRIQLGLSPMREYVLVAGSAAEAKELHDSLVEGYHILAAFEDIDQVVDLT